MLWFNMIQIPVGGIFGSRKLNLAPQSRALIDAPATGADDYPVNLSFHIPGTDAIYPPCETRWKHDPLSRTMSPFLTKRWVSRN